MSEKRIVIMGHAVDFSLIYYSIHNTYYREHADFILLNKMSEISVTELEICERVDLIFAFNNSYAEAKLLYKSLGREINKKCICLLEKVENEKDYDGAFTDKIIQWIYPKDTKTAILEMIMKMLCGKSYIIKTDFSQILKMSVNAPELKSEIMVYKGKLEEVVHESEYCVKRIANKKCKLLSITGDLTLIDVSNLYEIFRKESKPELIVSYKAEEEYGVLAMWQHNPGDINEE